MKKVFLAIAFVVVLAGCQAPGPGFSATQIDVVVTVEPSNKGAGVNREPIYVHARNGNTPIVWTIASAGYRFASTGGIEIINGGSEFSCSRKSDVVFICFDRYSMPGTYKYLLRLDGVPALDPTIVNN